MLGTWRGFLFASSFSSFCVSSEKFVRASLLLFVSAMARLNCSRMLLSSDERCSVLCSATRRRSFKAWNSRWYAISFSLPFCHAVYQERLRKDVKKMSAVATVPFLSLISFQRCLSSAECRGPRSCRCLPPNVSLCLQDVVTGVDADIWEQTIKRSR